MKQIGEGDENSRDWRDRREAASTQAATLDSRACTGAAENVRNCSQADSSAFPYQVRGCCNWEGAHVRKGS